MPRSPSSQYLAIESLSRYAREERESALGIIRNVLQMSDIAPGRFNAAMQAVAMHGRIALHFHPDRFDSRGLMVAEGLLQDGRYRCQFETHISSGLLSPEIGGARDHWERQFFRELTADIAARPKYGALDLLLAPNGPAPRFGSCYFLTKPEVLARATFCFNDSYRNPRDKGTADAFEMVMAALLTESFERRYALGEHGLAPAKLVERLVSTLGEDIALRFERGLSGNLDHYIEAQIHGPLSLAEDMEALVADPSFRGTEIEPVLRAIAERYQIALYWHSGLCLDVEHVVRDFRGAGMPSLAQRLAIDGNVTAYAIGVAAREVSRFPTRWRARGHKAEVMSELKWLWHLLVRYGAAREEREPSFMHDALAPLQENLHAEPGPGNEATCDKGAFTADGSEASVTPEGAHSGDAAATDKVKDNSVS
ncbi:DUF3626 domain-containing protein [Shewanella sp. FJAT-52076]|uniref:DUF3626 domain-containing protein n=1 Tax=Shewanella sp. FJAT-52076 TaxID=2864202 RepID=UPI001C65884F|nr:DUF3626 domain-containing protein [Shewanella sp. FJAT-52076]QYJ74470.1 DUF3626 domain-containing protein [Shewanella sp. FJAT-52076]